MSAYVVDASVAGMWYIPERHSEAARRLLRPGNELHAPDFLLVEFDNLLWKHVRARRLTRSDAAEIRSAVRGPAVRFHESVPLLDLAFELAVETQRTVYDSLYLALAVVIGSPVVTGDRRLWNALVPTDYASRVIWVEHTV